MPRPAPDCDRLLDGGRVHYAPAPEQHVIGMVLSDLQPRRLLLDAGMRDRQEPHFEAMSLRPLLEKRDRFFAVGPVGSPTSTLPAPGLCSVALTPGHRTVWPRLAGGGSGNGEFRRCGRGGDQERSTSSGLSWLRCSMKTARGRTTPVKMAVAIQRAQAERRCICPFECRCLRSPPECPAKPGPSPKSFTCFATRVAKPRTGTLPRDRWERRTNR
jgi:hypothetical protein